MFQMPCKYTTINLKAVTPVYGYLQLSYRNSGSFSKTFPFYGSFASSCLIMTLETHKQRAISAVPFTKLCGAEPRPVLLLHSQASDVTHLRSVPSGYVQRHVEHWWVKNSTKNDQKRQHPVKKYLHDIFRAGSAESCNGPCRLLFCKWQKALRVFDWVTYREWCLT